MYLNKVLRTKFEITGETNLFKKNLYVETLGVILYNRPYSWLSVPLIEDVMFLSSRGRLWYKHPLTFEGKDYSQWKLEVELWQMFTEMDKARQGITLALSLEGKAREIAISIDKSLLTTGDGVKNLLAELDKSSEKEKNIPNVWSIYKIWIF